MERAQQREGEFTEQWADGAAPVPAAVPEVTDWATDTAPTVPSVPIQPAFNAPTEDWSAEAQDWSAGAATSAPAPVPSTQNEWGGTAGEQWN